MKVFQEARWELQVLLDRTMVLALGIDVRFLPPRDTGR